MTITEQIDALRNGFPGCRTVALADISSGIVLCVSARNKPRQERLDALCTMASDLFASEAAPCLGTDQIDQGAILTPADICIFLRSPSDPTEALFAVCDDTTDLAAFTDSARATFASIAAQP